MADRPPLQGLGLSKDKCKNCKEFQAEYKFPYCKSCACVACKQNVKVDGLNGNCKRCYERLHSISAYGQRGAQYDSGSALGDALARQEHARKIREKEEQDRIRQEITRLENERQDRERRDAEAARGQMIVSQHAAANDPERRAWMNSVMATGEGASRVIGWEDSEDPNQRQLTHYSNPGTGGANY